MSQQFSHSLAAEFPEFIEFSNLLNLSEITWKRYGINAEALAGLDEWQLQMLLIKLGI